jgi:hypothetical protein
VNGLLKSISNPGRGCFALFWFFEPHASSLMHLLAHERKLKEGAEAKKGETKLKGGTKKHSEPKTAQSYEKSISNGTSHRQRCHWVLLLPRSKERPSLDELWKPRIRGLPHRQEFLVCFSRSLLVTQSLRRACQPKDGLWPTWRAHQCSLEIGHRFGRTIEFEEEIATEFVRGNCRIRRL